MEINQGALAADVKLYMETYAYTFAEAGAEKITKWAQESVAQYYADYMPPENKMTYDRTNDFHDNSYIKYKHNNGKSIYGGVRISADNMSPYLVGKNYVPAIDVLRYTAIGYHGSWAVTKSPISMIEEKMKSAGFLEELKKIGHEQARKQKYKVLNFS